MYKQTSFTTLMFTFAVLANLALRKYQTSEEGRLPFQRQNTHTGTETHSVMMNGKGGDISEH